MKPIKVSEASGAVLNWMVAKCEAQELTQAANWAAITKHYGHLQKKKGGHYAPSTDWAQGGPILEREHISVTYHESYTTLPGMYWRAYIQSTAPVYGPTILIAAMRCYCCSKLGDIIDVPEELCQSQNS